MFAMSGLTLLFLLLSWSSSILHNFPQTGSCSVISMNWPFYAHPTLSETVGCRKATLIFIIVMILWQGRLPCLRCRACKNGLTANRPPVMEPVIGWLAAKRMCRCLVNGWPIRCECGPQGRKVPIKGCFPPLRFIVIVLHIKPLHTIIPYPPHPPPFHALFSLLRLLNYNF